MPIEEKEGQTVVSLTGDILVLGFDPKQDVCNGIAWLLLQEREGGEIGRPVEKNQIDEKMCLSEQPGVLLGASNYRSLDIIIQTLSELRDSLKLIEEMECQ